jgi:CDP-glucose 4,6-dehydratase
MENLELKNLFGGIYESKKVVVTGHTGFKGSWLIYWLQKMGAEVHGIALDPPTNPNHFDLLSLDVQSYIQDINNYHKTERILKKINPDIIFHLAAQPLVRVSYQKPLDTLKTNIIGTANVLESSKHLNNLKAIIVITSDKCYENKEWLWGYRECEPMGGKDLYSASKGAVELVVAAYRNSFFDKENSNILLATARAGNVIGGGDWAQDRIFTDIVTSASNHLNVSLRFPNATRPWQHVLEPLSAYLMLGWKLLEKNCRFADAWNFGPNHENNVTVLELVKECQKYWKRVQYKIDASVHPPESVFLMLDSTKAMKLLGWEPVWSFSETVDMTIRWYREYYENNIILTEKTLNQYIINAKQKPVLWSK